MTSRRSQRILLWETLFTERYHTLELATKSPGEMLKKTSTVCASLSGAHDFESWRVKLQQLGVKLGCSWAHQNRGWEDALQEPGNRKRYPVGAQCRRPCTLQDSGKQEENYFLLWVLPVSSTGITSYQTSQVKYLHSPPIIIEQAKKNLRNSKYLDLRRTKCWYLQYLITCMFCKYFSRAVACLFIFLSVSFEKPAFLIWSGSNVSIFFFCHSWIFLF